MSTIKYVKKYTIKGKDIWTTRLFRDKEGTKTIYELLWGDRVRILDKTNRLWKVKARGITGYVNPRHLGNISLLELYFIDVGQGDGVLIRTPDNRHILIDGGWPRRNQPTGKNAADFVDWKFFKDYEKSSIDLEAMICSHNDQDHYGGLWDLLDKKQQKELNVSNVHIENFYHAGLSWWKGRNDKKTLGPKKSIKEGMMWTRLLEDRTTLEKALGTGRGAKLQGEWAKFLRKVKSAKTKSGLPTPVTRLSSGSRFVPNFEAGSDVEISVLAPVNFDLGGGKSGIRFFEDGNGKNTNGNSILLNLKFRDVKVLLTGDLNTQCMQSLLNDYRENIDVFECDVAKACHHGSGDVSISFLEAMKPACTIISSGDSEGHDHPRPNIIAASGLTGYKTVVDDKLVTPLVFSTEIARSVDLGKVFRMDKLKSGGSIEKTYPKRDLDQFDLHYKTTVAGGRNPKKGKSELGSKALAASTTYGLINVRTDGKTIVCASLNEVKSKWNISNFNSRFS